MIAGSRGRLWIAVALVLGAGCTPTDSAAVTTANLRADVQVLSTGLGGSTVSAWLFSHHAGDPPLNFETIRLVDQDVISAASNGHSVVMDESDLVVEYRYDAAFDTAEAGQGFEVSLDRVADASARHSTVTLPEPFTVTMPTTASRGAPLTITWSPSGSADPISLHLTGCADAQLLAIADTGTTTFPAGALAADPPTATCDLSVEVSRTRAGSLDPAYGQGGSIVATQQRTTTLTSTP
ncbi:MAG: hypothetical protein ABI591_18830 [Kofleriaceae bacterium]